MQEEGMQSRFLSGWRFPVVAAAVLGLLVLPLSVAQAKTKAPKSVLGSDQPSGLQMADQAEETGVRVVATYPRANYVWPYATGPYYGEVDARSAGDDAKIVTVAGSFRLERGLAMLPTELVTANRLGELRAQYFVVQLDPLGIETEGLGGLAQSIERHGGSVVGAMAVNGLMVRLTPEAFAEVEGSSLVRAVAPYQAAFKLHPSIGRVPLLDPIKAVSEAYELEVRIFPGEESALVAQEIAGKLGGNVLAVYPETLIVELNRSKLADLAQIQAVQMVHENLPVVPFGEETTTVMQTGSYLGGAVPYHDAGVTGGGDAALTSPVSAQVLMVLDSGIQLDAADLADTGASPGTAGPAHRKVLSYASTVTFGGVGDLQGCDLNSSGGFTHGHVVSATALGRPTDNPNTADPDDVWTVFDDEVNPWKVDGVAPGAKLIAYDGQLTPAAVSCADPLQDTITPGDLYSSPAGGSLGASYTASPGARVVNFSWGANSNAYTGNAIDIDNFLVDKGDALVFVSAGNASTDADNNNIADELTLGTPATTKNGLAVGATFNAETFGVATNPEFRAAFSSVGPAPGGRIAPQVMAPGTDVAGLGVDSEFTCKSNDNDQTGAVICDRVSNVSGTSFSSPAAAGAAMLVRDYYAQGFYPDGTKTNPGNGSDQRLNVSGPLVKATLIASTDFMTGFGPGGLSRRFRFNNEQGYGRIQLDNVLPVANWAPSPTGLIAVDGGHVPANAAFNFGNISGLDGTITVAQGATPDQGTFAVCDPTQEIRVALAWFDPVDGGLTGALVNNLDLEIVSPTGTKTYYGNYFTDDDNRDGVINGTTEDCPGYDGLTGTVSGGAWSVPVCQRGNLTNSPRDTANPHEAIMLSPDPLATMTNSQIEVGNWTIRVRRGPVALASDQRYAVVVAGGVCLGSSARFDVGAYVCNSSATVTVNELSETGDTTPTAATVQGRVTVQVLANSVVVDTETGISFTQPNPPGLQFESEPILLTDGTARDPGNGVLDVRSGDVIRVTYADVNTSGVTDPNKARVSSANVDCDVRLGFGNVTFAQFGEDTSYFVSGGCERNARGLFEFGFPDRYMDEGEAINFNFAYASNESEDLHNVEVDLRCAIPDGDSPATCLPNSNDCADPKRLNNSSCDQRPSGFGGDVQYMTIIDTPKAIGLIPAGASLSGNFNIAMNASIAGEPDVELILGVVARTSGKTTSGVAVSQHKLDVDEATTLYSTDFPTGGTETFDRNNNEIAENPTTNIGDFLEDYRFETKTYGDLTAGGTKNTGIRAPWRFDANDGAFRSGIGTLTDESTITNTIAQWGEDKNFNNADDRRCTGDASRACVRDADCTGFGTCVSQEQRDPNNAVLDRSWGTQGGCGWVTRAPNTCSNAATLGCYVNADCPPPGTCTGAAQATGGMWHTGRIFTAAGSPFCLAALATPGQCQAYETVDGDTGQKLWFELLVTPVVSKVNGTTHQVEIVNFSWNQAIDLGDSNAAWSWEVDTDTTKLEPVDLVTDLSLLNFLFGAYGAVDGSNNPDLTDGYSVFTNLVGGASVNGTDAQGNNRQADNSCFFEGGAVGPAALLTLGLPRPLDDDIDQDSDALIDEFVKKNGPIRNMDLFAVNGPDMRFSTLEDIYGKTGTSFQASIGLLTFEAEPAADPPVASYGVGVDDAVLEWREFSLAADTTNCVTNGECAVVDMQSTNLFEGSGLLNITVSEKTPDAQNDCNLDGTLDGTNDCDGNGTPDVVVNATVPSEPAGERVILNRTATPTLYAGSLTLSAAYDAPGVLYLATQGTDNPTIEVAYRDNNDGTGQICKNDVDPAAQGRVLGFTTVILESANVTVLQTLLTDNGDNDGWADTKETVNMRIRVSNKSGAGVTNVVARLSSNDPKIDCILQPFINFGDLADKEDRFSTEGFSFVVANVDRTTSGFTDLQDFSATFAITLAADEFVSTTAPQRVTLDLDLNATGGSASTTTLTESFESNAGPGLFGNVMPFEVQNIDQGRSNFAGSDGYRCQYSDPDWINSNSYGAITDCFIGASVAQTDATWWQVHTPAAIDGGRAYAGSNSLYMGKFGTAADEHTTPAAILEAVRTQSPVNLGFLNVAPELIFKHQISLMDDRTVNTPVGEAADRAVVHVQLADGAGAAVGNWIKLDPYLNVYDAQGTDNYTNCLFEPVDDGDDEDDFFTPSDPNRRLGPSSTCFPAFQFAYLGDTFNPFAEQSIGRASDGPGLPGSLGLGTWVESKFNLERFRGRRVRLRFLETALKLGTTPDWQAAFQHNPDPGDDGWWIDAVQVTGALASPATVSSDGAANSGLPACGVNCNTVTPSLTATPSATLAAPGQVAELSASGSVANRCADGVLQYQYWIDLNNGGSQLDTLVRGWTDNPDLLVAPSATTRYVVEVRCSSLTTCAGTTSLNVVVQCPSSGTLSFPTVVAPSKTTLSFGSSVSYNYAKGLISTLPTYSTAPPGGQAQNQGPATTFSISGDSPATGNGFWYLFRPPGALGGGGGAFCNSPSNSWGQSSRDAVLP
jgi:hypothetical protein